MPLAVAFFHETFSKSTETGPHGVILIDLDQDGNPVPKGQNFFTLTTKPSRAEAEEYAAQLSAILGFALLELV
jgi:hypothetical protein